MLCEHSLLGHKFKKESVVRLIFNDAQKFLWYMRRTLLYRYTQ